MTTSQINNRTTCSTGLKRSMSRCNNSSSARALFENDYKKSGEFANFGRKNNCSLLMKSNSVYKSSNNENKPRKFSSMIPRSKSRRTRSKVIIYELSSKGAGPSDNSKLNKIENKETKEGKCSVTENLDEKPIRCKLMTDVKENPFKTITNSTGENCDAETISLSFKSCEDFTVEEVDLPYEDAQEEFRQENKFSREEDRRLNEPGEEREAQRQEKIIRNLYETIKCTKSPLFEDLEHEQTRREEEEEEEILETNEKEIRCSTYAGQDLEYKVPEEPLVENLNVQEYYEYTIGQISDIWMNTISLMGSVKDHTLKFFEEKSKSVDKEQLSLEAEMLQLAVDFSINYSKLKTDFLLKGVKKRLGVSELEKTELENFMNSKAVAALYNDDDLAAMAQTVRELNTSLLKGVEVDLE